ncbi:MAG: general secretion pathway protein GspK [Phycisphaerae bacterium]|jgi:DNA uptake protein ComE-like DNA-binding protein|nr:general secretion pathway protein GspK [Phycisphaerae bacterium]HOO17757.1 type II secretion system protein GspK [Phycisphaerae bacterium]HPC20916.1 type II secretion system protein GspK [Phycisphaerae bacterium]HRS26831.1 type II secretion system protein GspK [Phycisphaerae bacterium]HRT40446.1 type II secretion system protein GspK [Phycisphaerae bacterium]
MARRGGFILPIVLIVISLLAVTMASFVFFVRAEVHGTTAHADAQQALLAAESGLNEVIATLRLEPHNAAAWFDSPERFRHKLIWCELYERDRDPVAKTGMRELSLEGGGAPPQAWRFSVVADRDRDPSGLDNKSMRFGITPESGKLNLNTADEAQIAALLNDVLSRLPQVENVPELINALLDWRDADNDTREGGAESDYYNTLEPPYNAKNGPFDSIEELLLVKGFNAAILYGEDVNRNGILDENENDGPESFPPYDNHDGTLDRGIAHYLTICSREPDTALDNKPRINLALDAATITAQIEESFTPEELEICQGAVDFILQLKGQNFDFTRLKHVAELYREGLQPDEGATDVDAALAASPITLEQLPYILDRFSVPRSAQRSPQEHEEEQGPPSEESHEDEEGEGEEAGQGDQERDNETPAQPQDSGPRQPRPRSQGQPSANPDSQGERAAREREQDSNLPENANPKERGRRQAIRPGQEEDEEQSGGEELEAVLGQLQGGGLTQGLGQPQGQQQEQGIPGLINVNTASARVLSLIPGITPEAVEAIIAARPALTPTAARTPAWLLSAGVDTATFHAIAPFITTKAYQYRVEVLGYADHNRVVKRCEWIIEMVGPVAQVRYFRDLTALGLGWPIDDEYVAGDAAQNEARGG